MVSHNRPSVMASFALPTEKQLLEQMWQSQVLRL